MLSIKPTRVRLASAVRVHRSEKLSAFRCAASCSKETLGFSRLIRSSQRTPLRHDRPRLRSAYIEADTYGEDEDDIVLPGELRMEEDEDEDAYGSDMYEELLNEEEEEVELSEQDEAATDATETQESESTEEETYDEEEMPSGCPKGFLLNCLWLEKYVAISVDQVFSGDQRSPMTEYFVWGRTDAWEELRERLSQNPWIVETDQILLLNRATEIINYWQDDTRHSLEEVRDEFPDCVFMGA